MLFVLTGRIFFGNLKADLIHKESQQFHSVTAINHSHYHYYYLDYDKAHST
jgi:hypothetical protein